MVQTLDFIFLCAWRDKTEAERIEKCLAAKEPCEMIVWRERLSFDPASQTVTVERASREVPFAEKIIPCRMPYSVMRKLLDHDLDDLTGVEWL